MSEHPVWRYDNQMPVGREFAIFHSSNTTAQPMVYHSHHFYEIYFILRGSIHVIADEVNLTPALGDALIYPPHCMHRVVHTDPSQPYERFYLYLSIEFLNSISTDNFNFIAELDKLTAGGQRYVRPGEQAVLELVPMADEIIEAAKDTSPAGVLANRCRMTMYLNHLLEILQKGITPETADTTSRMSELIRYINQNAAQPLTLDQLSEVFGISKFALLHEFKAHTGVSIYQYILTRRILLAQEMIRQGAKPRQACEKSGFSDYAGFYRAFKARTGISPSQYSKSQRG